MERQHQGREIGGGSHVLVDANAVLNVDASVEPVWADNDSKHKAKHAAIITDGTLNAALKPRLHNCVMP